jgi:hypothetical protein
MKKIRFGVIVLSMLFCSVTFAAAQVSIGIGIGLPNLSIGINLPVYPELVPVPGYPVYYAPQVDGNYFFYDGMYWVYQNDNWYASSWYNGPWGIVGPEAVPLFILRIPVSYYRQPPVYFRGWQSNAPPRWGQHWGRGWEQRRSGWDRWNRSSAPTRAPLPVYQRQYSGDRYPRVEQQHTLRSQSYRYQPRDKAVQQHFKQQEGQRAPAPAQRGRQQESPVKNPRQQDLQRSAPHQQGAPADPRSQPPQRGGEKAQRQAPAQAPSQQRGPATHEQRQQPAAQQRGQQQPAAQQRGQQQPAAQQHEQQAPRAQGQEQRSQDRGAAQEPNRGRGQEQNKDEERGRGRDK